MKSCASWKFSWLKPSTCRTRTWWRSCRRRCAAWAASTTAPAASCWPPSRRTTGTLPVGSQIRVLIHQHIGNIPFGLNWTLANQVIASLLLPQKDAIVSPMWANFQIQALFCFKSNKWKNPLHHRSAVCKAVNLCLYWDLMQSSLL